MNNTLRKLALLAFSGAALVAMTTAAQADVHSSIEYHGGKATYDKRIAQAAIERAAKKIGDLRGSIEGAEPKYFLTDEDLKNQSSQLGFPIIDESRLEREIVTGAVRIM